MKGIKFRAWNKEQKIMVHEDEDNSAGYWDGINISDIQMVNARLKNNEYIWLQYTGRKDKNEKEFCEGDIIGGMGFYKKEIYILSFDGFEFTLEAPDGHDYEFYNGDYPNGDLVSGAHLEMEGVVLGNIYENPELLKVKTDE